MLNFKHFAALTAFFFLSWQINFAQTSRYFDFECSSNCLIENNEVPNVETFYGRPKIVSVCGSKKLRLNYQECSQGQIVGGDGVLLNYPFCAGKNYKISYNVYKQAANESLGTALDFDLDWILVTDHNYVKTQGSPMTWYCGDPNYNLRPYSSNMVFINRLTARYIPWWDTWTPSDNIAISGVGNYCSDKKEFTFTPSRSGDQIFLRLDMAGWNYPVYGSAEVYLDDIKIEDLSPNQEATIINESFEGFNSGIGQINPFENGYNCWKPSHLSQSPELFSFGHNSFWVLAEGDNNSKSSVPAAENGNNYVSAALWNKRGVLVGSTNSGCENSEQLYYSGCKLKQGIRYTISFSLRIYNVFKFFDPGINHTPEGWLKPLEETNFSANLPTIEWRLNNSMIVDNTLDCNNNIPLTESKYIVPNPNGQLIWSLANDGLGTNITNTNIKKGQWVRYRISFVPEVNSQNLWFMPVSGNLSRYLVHLDNIVVTTDCNSYFATVCTDCANPNRISNIASSQTNKEVSIKGTDNINIFPNPLTDQSTIRYNLSKTDRVSIYLTDISGKIVKQLVTNKEHEAGTYEILMSKNNTSSGMYFIVMDGTLGKTVKKLIVD